MTEPLKAIEADAKSDPEGVVVPLITDEGTVDMPMLHKFMWWEGAVEKLVAGDVSGWVHLACDDKKALAAWDAAPKRYRDLAAFTEEWIRLTGEEPGKSPSSKPSSPRTRRR